MREASCLSSIGVNNMRTTRSMADVEPALVRSANNARQSRRTVVAILCGRYEYWKLLFGYFTLQTVDTLCDHVSTLPVCVVELQQTALHEDPSSVAFRLQYSSSSRLDPARPCSCMLPLPVLSSSAGPSSQELTRTGWDMLASRTVPDGKSEANHDYVHTWSKAEEYRALFTLCFLVQT